MVVVTGHEAERVRAALDGLDVTFAHNPDYAEGMSSSLQRGVEALDPAGRPEIDGAVVCLGDMPRTSAALIDRLIAGFNPLEGQGIGVPTWRGKRGNPVLWAARYFGEIRNLSGDVGARHLIGDQCGRRLRNREPRSLGDHRRGHARSPRCLAPRRHPADPDGAAGAGTVLLTPGPLTTRPRDPGCDGPRLGLARDPAFIAPHRACAPQATRARQRRRGFHLRADARAAAPLRWKAQLGTLVPRGTAIC